MWQREKEQNQTIVGLVRVMMHYRNLTTELCGYCFNTLLMFHVGLFKKPLDFSEFYVLLSRCILPF